MAISRTRPRRTGRSATSRGRPELGHRQPTAATAPVVDPAACCEVEVIDEVKVQRARHALPDPATVGLLAETLRALGDPTRLLIVSALASEDELCVCDMAALVGASQSAVSHSLRTLRQLRLVRYRKVGKIAYYALDDAHVARLVTEGVRHVAQGGRRRLTPSNGA